MEPHRADLSLAMLAHVQKTGQAIEILNQVFKDEIFDTLSKHNPYWHESEKLEDLRFKFGWIEDQINEVLNLLRVDPYEGNV